MVSALSLFTIGIGPSSSHTVGPMRAAARFAGLLRGIAVARVRVELYGSLAFTGKGHGTDRAVMLGLGGEQPETVEVDAIPEVVARIGESQALQLSDGRTIAFDPEEDLAFHRKGRLPFHPNGMRFTAFDEAGGELLVRVYYSVGGGFIVEEGEPPIGAEIDARRPFPFATSAELLKIAARQRLSIAEVMRANELAEHCEEALDEGLDRIWAAMNGSIDRGCHTEGVLPGGLKVRRRAPGFYARLSAGPDNGDPMDMLDWVTCFALAVSEENAAGGRVVTAPTNGAAGIIPAVMRFYVQFRPEASQAGVRRFLLAAAAIGNLYKQNASLSGAEVGCQGEVGVACSMAAAGLAQALGATNAQIEYAAEIAMEHHLGLTCDPVRGLVQIPCIERNAVASVGAIHACRMAMQSDGVHRVPLDSVIRTMRDTGRDMNSKYKETARGGLAVNLTEC